MSDKVNLKIPHWNKKELFIGYQKLTNDWVKKLCGKLLVISF